VTKYDTRIARVEKHLAIHNHDWQSVISLLKLKSNRILEVERQKYVEKLKKAYIIKREYDKKKRGGMNGRK